MISPKEIKNRLQARYNAGETQQEIAESTSISRTYIRDLLSGKSAIDGLTVKMINRLFPNATLLLDGGPDETDDLTRHMLDKWRDLSLDARCSVIAYMIEIDKIMETHKKLPLLHRIVRRGNPSRNVINCPVCRRPITVPASIEPGARFSCPDCGQHIQLGE